MSQDVLDFERKVTAGLADKIKELNRVVMHENPLSLVHHCFGQ